MTGPQGASVRPVPPEGISIRLVGAECFGIAADFRFRMFTDIDPGVDHSAERNDYLSSVAGYFSRHADEPGQVLVCAFDTRPGGRAGADIPVGCAAMIISERPPRLGRLRNDSAYVHNVYVLPEYRGRGIARALMNFLRHEAVAMNVRRIGLHASVLGAPLYSSIGYAAGGKYMELEIPDRD